MPAVRVGDVLLHYERQGTGEPLLWVTGFSISSAIFEPVVPLYRDTLDCITFDNRASGRSTVPRRPTSMAELAADAVRLLDALGVDSAHVYGLSMGGMIAQEMAIRFPDRVRGVVLGGTTSGGPGVSVPRWGALGGLAVQRVPAPVAVRREALAAALFSAGFRREHADEVDEVLQLLGRHRAGRVGALWHLGASVLHSTAARLPYLRAPTLVLHGERDTLTPIANAHVLVRRIPDAELRVVPGAGHLYLVEQPETARDLFLEWLRRHSPIPAGRPLSPVAARLERLSRGPAWPRVQDRS